MVKEKSDKKYKVDLREVNISTVNFCTRKCPYCYFGQIDKSKIKVRFMSLDLFKKILVDLKKANFEGVVSPFEGNEPLLDKRMPELVKMISKILPQAKSFIFSNGDLANEDIIKKLFKAGLSRIVFSLHDKKNEKLANDLVKKYSHDKVQISKMYGLDPESLHNFAGVVKNDLVSQRNYRNANCVLPFRQMVIDVNGNVNLCCVDIADRISFGNAKDRSAVDIFYHNKKLNNIREQLNKCVRRNPICARCSFPGVLEIINL